MGQVEEFSIAVPFQEYIEPLQEAIALGGIVAGDVFEVGAQEDQAAGALFAFCGTEAGLGAADLLLQIGLLAPLLHDFERLADTVLPFKREEAGAVEADKPSGRIIQFKQGGEADRQARRFSYETLHWDRVTDMRKLRELRGPLPENGRETFVFLMLNELAKSGQVNAHNFPYETVALARECDSFIEGGEWSRSTFSTLYRRVKEHVAGQHGRGQGLYRYKNATLIEKLEITPDEERHMKTLISTREKYRRWNDRRREARSEDVQTRREAKAKLHTRIRLAVRSGALSAAQAAHTYGLSRRHVYRIVK